MNSNRYDVQKKSKINPYEDLCGTIVSPLYLVSYNLLKPFDNGAYKQITGYNVMGKGLAKLPRKYRKKKKYNNREHFTLIMEDGCSDPKFFVDEKSLNDYITTYNTSLFINPYLFC